MNRKTIHFYNTFLNLGYNLKWDRLRFFSSKINIFVTSRD